jgi:hypothetical protein
MAGMGGEGGGAGDGATCSRPAAIEIPNSVAGPDLAIASAGSRFGILHRASAGTEPHLTSYDPLSRTFTESKPLSVPGVEPRGTGFRVSLTTLPDGHLGAAWTDQSSCYVSLRADTDAPHALKLSDTVGIPFPSVAISPFAGNRIAVAWNEAVPGTTSAYRVIVDIYDPDTSEQRKFTVEAPSRQASLPYLYLLGDRLAVVLKQTIPISGDHVATRNFFLATIGENDLPGMLTASPFISNSRASNALLFVDGTSPRVAYANGGYFQLSDLDASFALTGTPTPVMEWDMDSDSLLFHHNAEGEAVVFGPYGGETTALKLDENHQPLASSTALISESGIPTGFIRTSAGTIVTWYATSGSSAYLTPLCP